MNPAAERDPPPLASRLGWPRFMAALRDRFRAALRRPADGARESVHLANAAFRENLDRAPTPEPPACKRGCAWCCATRVAATVPEILALAQHIRQRMPAAERAATIARVEAEARALGAMPEADRGSHRRFCALLSAERACTVYPARPLGCRGVMAADAIACEENHHGTRAEVTYLGPPMQIRLAIHLPLMAALRAEGLAWKLHDLPIALAIALARADAEAAWRAGEPVFAAAALPDERFDPRKLDAVDALDPARG